MLLAVDIGNSNIDLGVFDGRDLRFRAKLSAAAERSADEALSVNLTPFLISIASHAIIVSPPRETGRFMRAVGIITAPSGA